MRICLECDSEYLDDPSHCRSCGARTSSPEEATLWRGLRERMATEDLVAVATLESPVEEAIIGRMLSEAGVVYAIHGGSRSGPFPGVDSGGALGSGKLLVLEDQVELAAEVVRHYRNAVVPDAEA
jgi:hypothetical protein